MEDDEILKKQVAGREQLGNLAPKFAELNDDVLFGEVWSREDELNLRDRTQLAIWAVQTGQTTKRVDDE